eukprot:CAMPEP_0202730040 /NCGR_PEP_ID=MMETSP1385-20130828/186439_1 /ASSEMBLY_ACC=CAM_ASM_000861 /TAXON_ID=933848 /ORGANISM="Elphidium margaritaceum" /LENGTH=474 /DNA_ID=CAMNT_0049396313 /DNA_START=9 /DNA_END=1434 /DNA_ORIENTATION=+
MAFSNNEHTYKPASRLEIDLTGGKVVWEFVERLRVKHNAINHGKGFPNWSAPRFVKKAAMNAIANDCNQYAPSAGLLELRQQIAKETSIKYGDGCTLNEDNVQITNGCFGGLDAAFRAFLNKGDEVVLLEPFFTWYRTQISHWGGVIRPVQLDLEPNLNVWCLNMAKLKAALNDKTRILLLNTPHNPTGFVLSLSQMREIAELLRAFPQVLVVTDQVYDYISAAAVHQFAALSPDTFARTIVCSSASKTFSVTGWRIGWVIAPKKLIQYINFAARASSWAVNTPCQRAMVDILKVAAKPYKGLPSYYEWLNDMYTQKRERIVEAIRQCGMIPIVPSGAFFVMVDVSKYIEILKQKNVLKAVDLADPHTFYDWQFCAWLMKQKNVLKAVDLADPHTFYDWQFCAWLMETVGVAVIPGSAFFDATKFEKQSDLAFESKFIRFAYCTSDDTIAQTARKMSIIPRLLESWPSNDVTGK